MSRTYRKAKETEAEKAAKAKKERAARKLARDTKHKRDES